MTERGVVSSDLVSARAALDELFTLAGKYNSSDAYLELMRFVGRFRFYSPFNAMLIHTQMPGAHFVCTAWRWRRDYRREIKINARPIVILQPMGPVLFVFDVSDTAPLPNARPLPRQVEDPVPGTRRKDRRTICAHNRQCEARWCSGLRTCRWFPAGRIHPMGRGRAASRIHNHQEATIKIDAGPSVVRTLVE
jgi:hypothetical protein